ncbi:MAG: hypothetical protein L6R38_001419 [Xanthoria sp. 2 TBL-2021]|nr:MAG: hypothetical protein L6R38_001419 [Xanthoria sp. 2 TBL-2021]
MNAAAYLTSQGWRGSGHALHPNGKGISKPLLVSKKTNVLGVGKKAHDAYADQWWSRAFDDTLRSLNGQNITGKVATSNEGDAKWPAIVPTRWTANGGLYGSFVRGEGLRGTRSAEQDVMETASVVEPPNKKRRLDDSRERLAERDRSSTKNHSKKRTTNKPSSNTGSKNGHASATTIEASTEVSPLRSRVSSRDIHQQEVMKNSKTQLVESKIDSNSLTDSTTCSEVAGFVGHSRATPILETADDKETVGQGEPQQHRSKRKERRLKKQGLIRDAASNGRETEPNTDPRVKKKKRKRRKDEGP